MNKGTQTRKARESTIYSCPDHSFLDRLLSRSLALFFAGTPLLCLIFYSTLLFLCCLCSLLLLLVHSAPCFGLALISAPWFCFRAVLCFALSETAPARSAFSTATPLRFPLCPSPASALACCLRACLLCFSTFVHSFSLCSRSFLPSSVFPV